MGRRKKAHARCPVCMLHVEDCMCSEFRPTDTRTLLALVLHRREWKKSSNTGRIAALALAKSERFIRGEADEPLDLSPLDRPDRRLLLLFPRDDAIELTPDVVAADPRPVTLVVPDGNWSQARRVVRREALLAGAQAVVPPPGPPTRYRIRQETTDEGMATAEAIARVMGVLEGEEVQREIERVFDVFVERTMASRGG